MTIKEKETERGEEGRTERWDARKLNQEKLEETLRRNFEGEESISSAEELVSATVEACDMSMPKRNIVGNRTRSYWWNEDIRTARRECVSARRRATRSRRKGDAKADADKESYKQRKKILNMLIKKSKRDKWGELCEEVDQDVWGLGYKIVLKRLPQARERLTPEVEKGIVDDLFPRLPKTIWEKENIRPEDVPLFTIGELQSAAGRIKKGKAPGPDGIPPEVAKCVVERYPEKVLAVMNGYLGKGEFPKLWKEAMVVLISKGRTEAGEQVKRRPICLINIFGKLLEGLINTRLKEVLENGRLSDNQFGFREGRSTTQAIGMILSIATKEKEKSLGSRKLCLMVALDVRNAFNSAPWRNISNALRRKGVPTYLVGVVESYLSDRSLIIECGQRREMTAGVPQGSVLGPTLWNALYDGVLELEMPEGVTLVAYADDLALVTVAKEPRVLEQRATEALARIEVWMRRHHLNLAAEKTQGILLIGRKRCPPLSIPIKGKNIRIEKTLKYLGVRLDRGLTFKNHVEELAGKGEITARAMASIMPRDRGAGEAKRRLLHGVMQSSMLYAAQVWGHWALKLKKNRTELLKAQRTVALRICRAYRTVSSGAAQVIARTIPIDLMIEERIALAESEEEDRRRVRERTLEKWQRRWQDSGGGRWTHRLIPQLEKWYGREHGEMTYPLCQVMTGHGTFGVYLKRIGKERDGRCWFCEGIDDAEHTMIWCNRWQEERQSVVKEVGTDFMPENLIGIMLESEEKWDLISRMVERIMRGKMEEEDRRRVARDTEQEREERLA